MKPRIGTTLASTVDPTTVVVIRWGVDDVDLTCGGAAMVDARGPEAGTTNDPDPAQMEGTLLGKRYADDEHGIELLCTKPGRGTLAVAGAALPLKDAKPLPASD
ncbi:hypothetical protein [Pseudonocardia sp.]|jgi:hypothetical protein|uniref:hypothetical protein n=1 Tax=Pseudonocardia sp. TaxID=60912 RepID=UPI002618CA82|nr:hypothetical protein [Pseudonocardia sp.]MCW2717873.1 hypothetical protein [Pseudonocardia sp.]